jgi:hypothetical protein
MCLKLTKRNKKAAVKGTQYIAQRLHLSAGKWTDSKDGLSLALSNLNVAVTKS